MNKAILIGRLTRDPELRYTTSNRAVCQFDLAINRPFINQETNQKEADFLRIILWDKQAENTAKYIHKGSQVAVEGRIQTRNYDNSEGKKVYVTEIVANNIQFLDSKSDNGNVNNLPEPPTTDTTVNNNTTQSNDPFAVFGEQINNGLPEISNDDLPF